MTDTILDSHYQETLAIVRALSEHLWIRDSGVIRIRLRHHLETGGDAKEFWEYYGRQEKGKET